MSRYPKKATFQYHIFDSKKQEWVDFKTLPEEQQEEIKIKNYQTIVKALGGVPVSKK